MTKKSISKEALELIEKIGPHLDKQCDVSYAIIPEGRTDCCVARRSVENLRSGGGYDTIYFFWQTEGKLRYKELTNSKSTQDYVHIDNVRVDGKKAIVVIHSGGTHKESPWKQTFEIDLVEIDLKA